MDNMYDCGQRRHIILNESEQALAKYLVWRWGMYEKTAKKMIAPNLSGAANNSNNLNAIGAEIGYCRLMNVYPNLWVWGDQDRPRGAVHDAVLPDGRTVNVKQSSRHGDEYDLIVPIHNYSRPDIYALLVGEFPEYYYRGYIEADKIIQEHMINKKLPVPAYAYPRRELKI